MDTSKPQNSKNFGSRKSKDFQGNKFFDSHQKSLISEKINIWDILFWIIIIILLIMVLTRMFGSSATEIQIYLGIISSQIIIVGYILKLMSNTNILNREVGEIKLQTANSFEKVREDMNKIKKKLKIQ